jgi:3-hydroxyacyl-CoA dehydrogenase
VPTDEQQEATDSMESSEESFLDGLLPKIDHRYKQTRKKEYTMQVKQQPVGVKTNQGFYEVRKVQDQVKKLVKNIDNY